MKVICSRAGLSAKIKALFSKKWYWDRAYASQRKHLQLLARSKRVVVIDTKYKLRSKCMCYLLRTLKVLRGLQTRAIPVNVFGGSSNRNGFRWDEQCAVLTQDKEGYGSIASHEENCLYFRGVNGPSLQTIMILAKTMMRNR